MLVRLFSETSDLSACQAVTCFGVLVYTVVMSLRRVGCVHLKPAAKTLFIYEAYFYVLSVFVLFRYVCITLVFKLLISLVWTSFCTVYSSICPAELIRCSMCLFLSIHLHGV